MIEIELHISQEDRSFGLRKIELPEAPRVGDRMTLDHDEQLLRLYVRQVEWLPGRKLGPMVIVRANTQP